jgi:hypothetical protein
MPGFAAMFLRWQPSDPPLTPCVVWNRGQGRFGRPDRPVLFSPDLGVSRLLQMRGVPASFAGAERRSTTPAVRSIRASVEERWGRAATIMVHTRHAGGRRHAGAQPARLGARSPPHGRAVPVWVHGGDRVQASLQFDALTVGVVPALALLLATPGLGFRRRMALLGVAATLCFAVDTVTVALFPVLVFYKNPFTDVVGTFLGLIAFVGAPVIIWFGLTFPQLRQSLRHLGRRRDGDGVVSREGCRNKRIRPQLRTQCTGCSLGHEAVSVCRQVGSLRHERYAQRTVIRPGAARPRAALAGRAERFRQV